MTSRVQPMNQGVIKNINHYYRKNLVLKYLNDFENSKCTVFSILDCIRGLIKAWDQVSSNVIGNCFKRASFKIKNSSIEIRNTAEEETPLSIDGWDEFIKNATFRKLFPNNFRPTFYQFMDCDGNVKYHNN